MSNPILEFLAQETGQTLEDLNQYAEKRDGKPDEVPDSPELRRILALPRRVLGEGLDFVPRMTQALRVPGGSQTLRPIQAQALAEAIMYDGGYFPIVPGGGKTLISYLIPAVLGAKRPLLLVPAGIREEALNAFRVLAQHWAGPHPATYRVCSYELLGRPQAGRLYASDGKTLLRQDYLDRIQPDVVVMDECDRLKDQKTSVGKRVRRYLREHPDVRVCAMTGTPTDTSIRDYAHIAAWCLPKSCPVPRTRRDLDAWCGALDEHEGDRVDLGALRRFFNDAETSLDNEGESLEAGRLAFARRLVETPGVVATQESRLDIPLILRQVTPEGDGDPIIDEHFATLRADWKTPDGWELADGLQRAKTAKELALGFHYMWVPRPPKEWLEPRQNWAKWCRLALQHNRRGWDSERQIKDAIDSGALNDGGLLAAWRAAEPTFTPNVVPVWHSMEAIDIAAKWLETYPGICWTAHTAFGEKLAEATGLSYYGKKGKDPQGRKIEKASGPVIASIASSGVGRNLQQWRHNLIMSMPKTARKCEQLLARTHRPGQLADKVETWIYAGCYEHVSGFAVAMARANYTKTTTRSDQRLLYADTSGILRESDITARKGARWSK